MTGTRSVVDLFCGAGGTSEGVARACEGLGLARPSLVAINHWTVAVETHRRNHPWATHHCARVESLDPERVAPGALDLLVAGCECTHHSQARGGKPMSDQSRASAWHVVHWAERLRAEDVLVENVPEFLRWGPLGRDDRPIASRRGETFRAFVGALESLDYRVEWQVLNAADFGDPQRRRRLFLRARRGRRPIAWPSETHAAQANGRAAWRTAREIIDWSDLGTSIFQRARPLAPRTLARIAEGIRRFCGQYAEPFLVLLYGTGTVRSVDLPAPTITTGGGRGGGHVGLAQPFLVPRHSERGRQRPRTHGLDAPMPTVAATNAPNLITPFLAHVTHGRDAGRVHGLDAPTPTVTAAHRGELAFIAPYYRTGTPHSTQEPLPTVTTHDRFALVTPDGIAMDIFFRMLKPRELARAQSFPEDYEFGGNKSDVIKQIGNAVPVGTATALARSILGT